MPWRSSGFEDIHLGHSLAYARDERCNTKTSENAAYGAQNGKPFLEFCLYSAYLILNALENGLIP